MGFTLAVLSLHTSFQFWMKVHKNTHAYHSQNGPMQTLQTRKTLSII